MASTVFVDYSQNTPVVAAWLNDVNSVAYGIGSSAGQLLVSNGVGNLATWTSTPTLNNAVLSGITTANIINAASLNTSGFITPNSVVGIKASTTSDSPAAGAYGEELTNSTTGTSLANNTPNNATFVDLPAGDWIVTGLIQFIPAGTTTISALSGGASSTSGSLGAAGSAFTYALSFTTGVAQNIPIPRAHFKNSGPGNLRVFLVAVATFGVSTMTCNGYIQAIRPR